MISPDLCLNGIDVCAEDGEIAWDSIRNENVLFCMVKATEGAEDAPSGYIEDPSFSQNFRDAYLRGFRVGAYHNLVSMDIDGARIEANGFLKVLRQVGIRLNFYCGVVCPTEFDGSSDDLAVCLDVFCGIIAEAGYVPVIHAPLAFLRAHDLSYPFWLPYVGKWEDLPERIQKNVVLWQYRMVTAPVGSGHIFHSALLDSTVLFEQIFNKTVIRYPDHKRRRGKRMEINTWAIRHGILPIDEEIPDLDLRARREETLDWMIRFMDYYRAAYAQKEKEDGHDNLY